MAARVLQSTSLAIIPLILGAALQSHADSFEFTCRYPLAPHNANVLTVRDIPEIQTPEDAMILTCGARCSEVPPDDRFDRPLCDVLQRIEEFGRRASEGDAEALATLHQWFRSARPLSQKHTIADYLLPLKTRHHEEYWAELEQWARLAVQHPPEGDGVAPFFQDLAAAENGDEDRAWSVALDAFSVIAPYPRARDLVIAAIDSSPETFLWYAIEAFAEQEDTGALVHIARGLARVADPQDFAEALLKFDHPDADALARSLCTDEEWDALVESYSESYPREEGSFEPEPDPH